MFIINYLRALIPREMFPSRKASYLLRVGAGRDELDFGPRIPLVFFCLRLISSLPYHSRCLLLGRVTSPLLVLLTSGSLCVCGEIASVAVSLL